MPAVVAATQFSPLAPPWDLSKLDTNFALLIAALASQNTYSNFLLDTGAAGAYVTALPAGVTGTLSQGLAVQFLVANTNAGASTLAYAGNPAKNIVNMDGSAMAANQLVAGAIVQVIYDGTKFILVSGGGIIVSTGTWVPSVGGNATYTGTPAGVWVRLSSPSNGSIVYFSGSFQINVIGTGSTSVVSGLTVAGTLSNDLAWVRVQTAATPIVSCIGTVGGTSINVLSRTAAAASDSAVAVFGNGSLCTMAGIYRAA